MSTQLKPKARDPSQAGPNLNDRPALDEAHIRLRSPGRQLVIDTGGGADEVEAHELDVDPEAEGTPEANGEDSPPVALDQTIRGFSADSRRRLRKRLHALRRDAEGLFITLTYHQTKPDPERAKRDLDAFWKRLRRRFGGVSAVWKMEPQERGVPHFHLMIFGVDYIPARWLSLIWHQITDEPDSRHKRAGVDLEAFVNQDGKLQAYMADYMEETYEGWPGAEEGDPWAEPGRWWGCLSREDLPWADWDDAPIYLDAHEARALIRSLLDDWDADLPDEVIPPTLTINTRGDPAEVLHELLGG